MVATPEPPAPTDRWIIWLRRIIPLIFLSVLIFTAWHELIHLDAHKIRVTIQAVPDSDLFAEQLFALLAVFFMSMYDLVTARAIKIDIPIPALLRYSWVANSFNNLVGLSGLAGSGIRFLLLSRSRVEGRLSALFSGLILLSIPVGLATLAWPLLISGHTETAELPLPSWILEIALGGYALFLPAYILILRSNFLRRRFLPNMDRLGWIPVLTLIGVSLVDWLLAISVAWSCILLAGANIPFVDFTVAFILAAVLGILSFIPGGLGVFDTALLALLGSHSQVSVDQLMAGLIIFRVIYYLMPWFIGIYLGSGLLTLGDRWKTSRWTRYWQDSEALALIRLPLDVLSAIGVRLLSFLTFGAGIVLLISASFPTLTSRLKILGHYFPLYVIEASHLFSVAVAILLIAVARGIADQVRSAYHLALGLLFSGAVLSLLKGIDYEEAAILTLIATALWLQRKKFYRHTIAFNSTRTIYWSAGMLVALLGFIALGTWVYGETPFHVKTLSSFAYRLETPRYARSLLLAVVIVLIILAWSLFRSAKLLVKPADESELEKAKAILDEFGGSSFSHLIFLGDKSLFWSKEKQAYIQYAKVRDRLVALGDPCGNSKQFEQLILDFREYADLHDLIPVFYEITDQQAYRYHDTGFALFKLGEMAYVKLDEFSLAGRRGESLRHSYNLAKRLELSFEIWPSSDDPQMWATFKAISDAWLGEFNVSEKTFSLGNFSEEYLKRTPIAIVRQGEKIVAFANLMPDYGPHVELSIDLMRYQPGAPSVTMDFMFIELLNYARAENYQYFNLGMAPLAGVGEARFARTQERLARLAFEYGNRFYNYKGLRSFKEKFRPYWRSYYLAYPVYTPLPPLLLDTAALVAGGYRRIFTKLH